MLLLNIKNNIQGRFQISVLLTMFCISFLSSFSLITYNSIEKRSENDSDIERDVSLILANNKESRQSGNYISIQRLLLNINHIKDVVLYDSQCEELTPSIFSSSSSNVCSTKKSDEILISYPDVLSKIKFVKVKTDYQLIEAAQVITIFIASIFISILTYFLLIYFWRRFVYLPLKYELAQTKIGQLSNLTELGDLGRQMSELISHANRSQMIIERANIKEQMATNALKIAHDLLTPINFLQNDHSTKLLGAPSLQAINDIRQIALGLLPEKGGIKFSCISIFDLIRDCISQVVSSFLDIEQPVLETEANIYIFSSRIHLSRTLKNIIKNAIEASPRGTAVKVRYQITDNNISIEILNVGSGFILNEKTETTKIDGSGLGISSSLTNLSLIKGSLRYSSEDNHTRASILLPISYDDFSTNKKYVLIEDDKYICEYWRKSAEKSKRNLKILSTTEFELSRDETIFYDRFICGTDISNSIENLVREGYRAYSISAIDSSHAKVPPWELLTPPA